ncbi:MAG: UDP-N-acetylmuramate:L-alanyl-gamma-D-glutamyl-meso-diaminopimelate ligase, partial [Burkholderiaceae bacterium]
ELGWSLREILAPLGGKASILGSVNTIVETLRAELVAGDHCLIMSNGGFGGLHTRLAEALSH